jgi:hypothetical protein
MTAGLIALRKRRSPALRLRTILLGTPMLVAAGGNPRAAG